MIPANIEVSLDKKAIREYIEHQIQEEARNTLLLVDLKRLSQMLCMSERYIEDEILRDPRVRRLEVRRNRKRWWRYKPLVEVLEEIISEW